MKLYLMRHGRAGDAPADAHRQLTDAGRRDVKAVVQVARARGFAGAQVLTSPLVRARQTAELVASRTGCALVEEVAVLSSGATLDELLDLLHRQLRHPAVLLVGHMPDLGLLAGFLAWGERGRALNMQAGTMVALTVEHVVPAPRATLDWVVSPQDAA